MLKWSSLAQHLFREATNVPRSPPPAPSALFPYFFFRFVIELSFLVAHNRKGNPGDVRFVLLLLYYPLPLFGARWHGRYYF